MIQSCSLSLRLSCLANYGVEFGMGAMAEGLLEHGLLGLFHLSRPLGLPMTCQPSLHRHRHRLQMHRPQMHRPQTHRLQTHRDRQRSLWPLLSLLLQPDSPASDAPAAQPMLAPGLGTIPSTSTPRIGVSVGQLAVQGVGTLMTALADDIGHPLKSIQLKSIQLKGIQFYDIPIFPGDRHGRRLRSGQMRRFPPMLNSV